MHILRLALLPAIASLAAGFAVPRPAAAQTVTPSQLLGAWGPDSSCTGNVVIFRADGSVLDTGAVAGTPPTTYEVNGDTIAFTQGNKTGHFALAVSDEAVAWSDGSAIVLKERCADQKAFASDLGPPAAPATLYDKVRALAAEPVQFNGITIKIMTVEGRAEPKPSASGALYSEIIAHPDPETVGAGATLLYRIFPTTAAAADHVSLVANNRTSFIYEHRGAGFFSTASATDEGNGTAKNTPVTIDCFRFHPKGQDAVQISCFAHMPGSRLVAGGRQTFPLPAHAKANDMGSKDDLNEVLDLTSLAIGRLRGFLAASPSP